MRNTERANCLNSGARRAERFWSGEWRKFAAQNRLPYKDAAREFGLQTVKWPYQLEKVYVGVPRILEALSKNYRLGVLANQSAETEWRLQKYGICQYFDLIISSAEIGFSKPDLKIFEIALDKAGCAPSEAYMIGDRLDNDIEPATRLGMRTIWVRQGVFAGGSLKLIHHRPDHIVSGIEDITEYL